jgi:hypothetical protein
MRRRGGEAGLPARERSRDSVLPASDLRLVAGFPLPQLGRAVGAERGEVIGDVDLCRGGVRPACPDLDRQRSIAKPYPADRCGDREGEALAICRAAARAWQGSRSRRVLCTRAADDAARHAPQPGDGEGQNRTGDTTIFSRGSLCERRARAEARRKDVPAKSPSSGPNLFRPTPPVRGLVDARWTPAVAALTGVWRVLLPWGSDTLRERQRGVSPPRECESKGFRAASSRRSLLPGSCLCTVSGLASRRPFEVARREAGRRRDLISA